MAPPLDHTPIPDADDTPPPETQGDGESPVDIDTDSEEPKCPHVFEVVDLRKRLGLQKVLRGVTLNVRRGECMVILGASGEGKSVFLKHLIGLLHPDTGTVKVDGVDISRLRERKLGPVRRKIGVLFQDGALFDSMTVADNVAFPLHELGVRDRDEIRERVLEALTVVELEEHLQKMPIELSGGMRKRVGLARAIIAKPHCILYDEPTAGLDPVVADSINHLIRRLQNNFDVTSVVVTHDMKNAYHVADRMAYLREGRIYFLGTPDEFRNTGDDIIRDFIEGTSHGARGAESEAVLSPEA